MTVLSAILYLLLCTAGSAVLTRALMADSGHDDVVSRCLTWTVMFFAIFFGGFHALGYVNLFTDLPVVDSLSGAAVVLVAFVGFRLWPAKRTTGLAERTEANAQRRHDFVKRSLLPGNALSRTLTMAGVLILVLIVVMLGVGFPRGYEAQGYHLPIGVHMFQSHSLKVWRVWDTVFFHTLPANASIYFGFLLALAPEHLVAPAGLVFLVVSAVAVYGIGRATGADETACVLAALGLVTVPIVVAPATDAVSDVGGMAFLAAAIYFVVSRPAGRLRDLVLSGLAAGLSFGFKSLHLPAIAFLFLVVFLQTWNHFVTLATPKRLWITTQALSVFLAATLATSGFWLVRNYVQLGNPLYPVHFRFFDVLGWTTGGLPEALMPPIWVRSPAEWFVYPWVEWMNPGESVASKPWLGRTSAPF